MPIEGARWVEIGSDAKRPRGGHSLGGSDRIRFAGMCRIGPRNGVMLQNRAVVIAIAVGLAAGLALSGFVVFVAQPKASGPATDGPTYDQALLAVNSTVRNSSGGPWVLFGVYGIAAPHSFEPTALATAYNNQTVNECGAAFNGITIWNGSIPTFSGALQSGTAPFWQFFFFSNASQQILVGTSVLGVPRVFPPISFGSACARASRLWYQPWYWANEITPLLVDSPVIAQAAWSAAGERWAASHGPLVETYVFGPNVFADGTPNGVTVNYWRCGQVGVTGNAAYLAAVEDTQGLVENAIGGYIGCTWNNETYDFALAVNGSTTEGGTTWMHLPFQVEVGGYTDAWGLVTWMTSVALLNSSGEPLPPAPARCNDWVPSVTGCTSSASGWYVVLLSASGGWLDTFGAAGSGTGWTLPNVSVVSNQELVLVVGGGWSLSGDTLVASGTSSQVSVAGSVVL